MFCRSCGKQNQDDFRYCQYCGRDLLTCASCGKVIPREALFCGYCGDRQNPEPSAPAISAPPVGPDRQSPGLNPATIGKTCPYCQMPVKPGAETILCSECGIAHHAECWRENGGKCTTYGCKGTAAPEGDPADLSPQPAPTESRTVRQERSAVDKEAEDSENRAFYIVIFIFIILVVLGILTSK